MAGYGDDYGGGKIRVSAEWRIAGADIIRGFWGGGGSVFLGSRPGLCL